MTEDPDQECVYDREYFEALDNRQGYRDSVMWEDIAHCVKEFFGYDRVAGKDIAGSLSVVDVGCAKGYLVRHLRRRGFDAWGLDVSRYAIGEASADTREYLRWFDLTKDSGSFFGRDRFNIVTSIETLEHVEESGVTRAIGHLRNLLVPGGEALLTVCVTGQPGAESDRTHATIRPRSWWIERFCECGLRPLERRAEWLKQFWLFSAHKGVFILQKDPG